MSFRKLGLLVAVGLSSVLVACGPSCVSTCEQGQEDGDCFQEADADGSLDDVDCDSYCEDLEDVVSEDNADCEEELDEALSCANDGDDVCDALEDDCDDEVADLVKCIQDFCVDHQTNDACQDV